MYPALRLFCAIAGVSNSGNNRNDPDWFIKYMLAALARHRLRDVAMQGKVGAVSELMKFTDKNREDRSEKQTIRSHPMPLTQQKCAKRAKVCLKRFFAKDVPLGSAVSYHGPVCGLYSAFHSPTGHMTTRGACYRDLRFPVNASFCSPDARPVTGVTPCKVSACPPR